jgi:hypothetical protein
MLLLLLLLRLVQISHGGLRQKVRDINYFVLLLLLFYYTLLLVVIHTR